MSWTLTLDFLRVQTPSSELSYVLNDCGLRLQRSQPFSRICSAFWERHLPDGHILTVYCILYLIYCIQYIQYCIYSVLYIHIQYSTTVYCTVLYSTLFFPIHPGRFICSDTGFGLFFNFVTIVSEVVFFLILSYMFVIRRT